MSSFQKTTISVLSATSLLIGGLVAASDEEDRRDREKTNGPSITLRMAGSTQGPLWPPSEIVDKDGNFIVVGDILRDVGGGEIKLVPGAALVSPHTVPPLNASGVEDFSNIFGAPYKIVKELDLSRGSPDLNLELYTASYGPPEGSFGGGGRIPKIGQSRYNLNAFAHLCPEAFPSESQRYVYTSESISFAKKAPLAFRGDQVSYDVNTGAEQQVAEDRIDKLPDETFTLGRWLRAKGTMKITLLDFSPTVGAYTAAKFEFKFKDLIPNSVYTVWNIRQNVAGGNPESPNPIKIPNVFISDEKGDGELTAIRDNPFPVPAEDPRGLRSFAFVVMYHSDHQNWGACPQSKAPGVDGHVILSTAALGPLSDATKFVTRAKR